MTTRSKDILSIVVPLYNEEPNIEHLLERLLRLKTKLAATIDLEVVLVDDGSKDQTFAKICTAVSQYPFIRAVQLSKNSGSHAAIAAGFSEANGDCAVFLAGDLQDPPELILQLLEKWRTGSKVVWASKVSVNGKKVVDTWFSALYWKLFLIVNEVAMPPGGADFALVDKKVVDAIKPRLQKPIAIFTLIAQTGFTPAVVFYEKQSRSGGSSGWTLRKKFALILESVLIPAKSLRIVAMFSCAVYAVLLLLAASLLLFCPSLLAPPLSTAVLVAAIIIIGLLQTLALTVIGEYLYSILSQVHDTPRFVIAERITAPMGAPGPSPVSNLGAPASPPAPSLQNETLLTHNS